MTEWKQFEGYEVSNYGEIRKRININHPERCKPYVVLKHQIDKDGYSYVRLNGKKWMRHRLVYFLFVGNLVDGLVVFHVDGDLTNNSSTNLLQATQKENISHKMIHGTWQEMESHPNAKITRQVAKQIKQKLSEMSIDSVAAFCNVSRHIVADISRNRTWRKA